MRRAVGRNVFGQLCTTALRLGALACLGFANVAIAEEAPASEQALRTWCASCHTEDGPGHFQRVSEARKTPEGWLMTIVRMQHVHGVPMPDEARDSIVKYLADTQGLAPSESQAGRYSLERRPNVQDLKLGDDLNPMCGRCHSLARVVLQRRAADEWLKLMHFHVGQIPTLEYQSLARDRFWWQVATTELPAKLGAMLPFDSPAWREWSKRAPADLTGNWIVYGRAPGRGDYVGSMKVSPHESGGYVAEYSLHFAKESDLESRRSVVRVYTGYEWRGSSSGGSQEVREVFALSEDGRRLTGRWFDAEHIEVGGDIVAERSDGEPAVFAVLPRALKSGSTQEVRIVGRGLTGAVDFGPGTQATVVAREPGVLRVTVTIDPKATVGERDVRVGRVESGTLAVIYDRVAHLEVTPTYAIARVGGGRVPPVTAQFEALGFLAVPPGDLNTPMIPLGPLDAVWSVEPYNEVAVEWDDLKFAGTMDPGGRFVPAEGGPNPARKFSTNNTGDFKVVAGLASDAQTRGEAHLIVSIQRWISTPID